MKSVFLLRIRVLIAIILLFPSLALTQNKSNSGSGEVSEIIIPTAASVRNNFNLFYEIHVNNKEIPSPSYWYKIIFSKACSFEFTLIPVNEDDKYDFFFYKVEANIDFCSALKAEKVISCNTSRTHKVYTNKEQSEKFRAGLVDVNPISVKPGDAIYIEVISTKGGDCGHILDFRTTTSSFVVKVINDNCSGNAAQDSIKIGKYKPEITDEKNALAVLSKELCPDAKKPLFISAIHINEQNVSVSKKLDFVNYSREEAPKYLNLSKKESSLEKPVVNALPDRSKKQVKDSIVTIKNVPEDSVKRNELVLKPKPTTIIDTQNLKPIVKSTADLNSLEPVISPINHDIHTVPAETKRNATRLEVDNVLFSLLREDIKRKMESDQEQLKEYSNELKKSPDKTKKEELTSSVKETKLERAELQTKLKATEKKIKLIAKLLRAERKNQGRVEEPLFAKGSGDKKADSTSINTKTATDLVYRIQIGVYKNAVSADVFKGLNPIFEENFSGGVKYSVGSFSHFTDAQHAKDYIRNMGLTGCFVVAYYNGKRVTIEEAKNQESKY